VEPGEKGCAEIDEGIPERNLSPMQMIGKEPAEDHDREQITIYGDAIPGEKLREGEDDDQPEQRQG
jgi:hypothetical protein